MAITGMSTPGDQHDPADRFDPADVELVRRAAAALGRLRDVAVLKMELDAAHHFGEAAKHLRQALAPKD